MRVLKVLFAGPVDAGKTTAVSVLSDLPPISTEEATQVNGSKRKPSTTVAMDFGVVNVDGEVQISLYGTPGLERFDFMWEILADGVLGLVLLINNSRPDPFGDLHRFVEAFKRLIESTGLIVGVTKMDRSSMPRIDDYHLQLEGLGFKVPVFEVDTRKKEDVSLLLQALLITLDPGLESRETEPTTEGTGSAV